MSSWSALDSRAADPPRALRTLRAADRHRALRTLRSAMRSALRSAPCARRTGTARSALLRSARR